MRSGRKWPIINDDSIITFKVWRKLNYVSIRISLVKPLKVAIRTRLILISSVIFFLGIFVGYSSAHTLKSLIEEVTSLYSFLVDVSPPILTVMILANNVIKTFLFMIFGALFAIPPALLVLTNGFILGAVSFFVVEEKGVLFLLAGLLPHGVFEIPALLLSSSLGFEVGISMIKKVRGRDVSISNVIVSCIKAYFKIVVPLLILAAFIEVYITSFLLQQLL